MSEAKTSGQTISEEAQLQEIDERHDLALQLFEWRNDRGWSQEDLADRAGMTQPQIARLEAGQSNPTLRSLTKLAHTFGVRVGELLGPHMTFSISYDVGWARDTIYGSNVREISQLSNLELRRETAFSRSQFQGGVSRDLKSGAFEPQSTEKDPSTVAA